MDNLAQRYYILSQTLTKVDPKAVQTSNKEEINEQQNASRTSLEYSPVEVEDIMKDKDDDSSIMEKVGEAYTRLEKGLSKKVTFQEQAHELEKNAAFEPIIIYKTTVEPGDGGKISLESGSQPHSVARDMAESRERVKNSNLWNKLLNKVKDMGRPHVEVKEEQVPERTYDPAFDL